MKKILVLLSLIYFISCSTLCEDKDTKVVEGKSCFSRSVEEESKHCCYVTGKHSSGQSLTQCFEGPIKMSLNDMKSQLKEQLAASDYTLTDLGCPEVKEEPKLKCADTTVPESYKSCGERVNSLDENNSCCFYKISSGPNSFTGCVEIPSMYNVDTIQEKYFKEFQEKGFNVDSLICPTKTSENDSSKAPPEGNWCNSGATPKKKEDCYGRRTQGDKEKYYCCFMKTEGDDSFNSCYEYQKKYDVNEIKEKINTQYSPYGIKVTEFYCPSSEEEKPTDNPNASDIKGTGSKGSYIRPALLLIFALLI
jgi:hypothetical protein